MRIETSEKSKEIKLNDLSAGMVCKISNTIAIRITCDNSMIDERDRDDFICENFFEESEYDREDYDYCYKPLVNLDTGELFFLHRDTKVLPLLSSKVVID